MEPRQIRVSLFELLAWMLKVNGYSLGYHAREVPGALAAGFPGPPREGSWGMFKTLAMFLGSQQPELPIVGK